MNTNPQPIIVGALLFPDFELLDFYGPLEMFGGLKTKVKIVTMAMSAGAIRSTQGPSVIADLATIDAPNLDVLLVPGGIGTRREVENKEFLSELTRLANSSRYVASVCTGSALLARCGVLDGKNATSNKAAFHWVVSQGPKVQWIPKARWVEDGKFFTSAGVSAGMDMALGLIAHLFDLQTSQAIANWTEYEWHEDKDWDPFAKINGLQCS